MLNIPIQTTMKRFIYLSGFGCFLFFASPAQPPGKIHRAYAFFKVITPGNIPVDDNGRPIQSLPNIERFIYIECSGAAMPVVTNVLYDGISFAPLVTSVDEMRLHVGKKPGNNRDVELSALKNNRFWKIGLQASGISSPPPGVKHILIKTRSGSKPHTFTLYKETELMAPEMY